jgi:hypothetical protein
MVSRGIPTIKPSNSEKDAGRKDALAQAKAAVAAELAAEAGNIDASVENGAATTEETAGKKRPRDAEDDAQADGEREVKKAATGQAEIAAES